MSHNLYDKNISKSCFVQECQGGDGEKAHFIYLLIESEKQGQNLLIVLSLSISRFFTWYKISKVTLKYLSVFFFQLDYGGIFVIVHIDLRFLRMCINSCWSWHKGHLFIHIVLWTWNFERWKSSKYGFKTGHSHRLAVEAPRKLQGSALRTNDSNFLSSKVLATFCNTFVDFLLGEVRDHIALGSA